MDRARACRLWLGTLDLGLPADDEATRSRLGALWSEAGLDAAQRAPLLDALRLPVELDRRCEIVRRTRLCLTRAGHDPDRLSTPAAGMRGL